MFANYPKSTSQLCVHLDPIGTSYLDQLESPDDYSGANANPAAFARPGLNHDRWPADSASEDIPTLSSDHRDHIGKYLLCQIKGSLRINISGR